MSRPLRLLYPGALYHITARDNERKEIFRTDPDREAFLAIIAQVVECYRLILHAYILMNNHYHLLMETKEGNLPLALRHLNGLYTRAAVSAVLSKFQFLKTGPRSDPERAVLFYLGWERGGMSLKALAERFGVDDSAVSQGAKRVSRLRLENAKLHRILQRIETSLISNI